MTRLLPLLLFVLPLQATAAPAAPATPMDRFPDVGAGLASPEVQAPRAVVRPGTVRWIDDQRLFEPSAPPLFPGGPNRTRALQILMLAGLALVVVRGRRLAEAARRVPRHDWLLLVGIVALAAGLRLIGGVRVPGYHFNHGFAIVHDLLLPDPPVGYAYHGNGLDALHGLFLTVLPRSEGTILGVQFALSVLSVPAAFAAGALWLRSRSAGLWAAASLAAMPAVAYFGLTEVHQVPGSFFVLASLALAGLAVRTGDFVMLLAALVGAVIACQFQPVLQVFPAILLALLAAVPGGRALLKRPDVWMAAGLLLVFWIEPAWLALRHIFAGQAVAAHVGLDAPRLAGAFLPTTDDLAHAPGNRFLSTAFTPSVFPVLALAGLVAGLRSGRRWVVAVLFGGALAFTLPVIVDGRVNPARLQHIATVFEALLCGFGAAWIAGLAGRGGPEGKGGWRQVVASAALAGVVAASIALQPGLLGRTFTPHIERVVIAEGLATVDDDCVVLVPSFPDGPPAMPPTYLPAASGRPLRWGVAGSADLPASLSGRCVLYYRPPACWDFLGAKDPSCPDACGGLRRECFDLERGLGVVPLLVRDVPALPDYLQSYSRPTIEIGLFRKGDNAL